MAVTRRDHRSALGLVELAPLDLLGERLLEGGDHGVGARLVARPEDHLEAGLRGDLGDARAHDPRADDPHPLHGHGAMLPVG